MKILAIESSAISASVAVCEEERLIAQSFQQTGLTHSQTLLPMVDSVLKSAGMTIDDIELLAVAAGPGSFTGLRIGVSVVKGLAWAKDLPCAACSTLESMAWNVSMVDGEICTAMDARRGQVYHARFLSENGQVHRLTDDRPIALEDLAIELEDNKKTQWIVGDGANICYEFLKNKGLDVRLAPPNIRFQQAWGVARVALEHAKQGKTLSGEKITPEYHRLSQAERELKERKAME